MGFSAQPTTTMAATKFLVSIFIVLLVSVAVSGHHEQQQQARQCRLQRLRTTQPSQKIKSEGGVTELWDENEDQFQCVGVAAKRHTIQPNSLSLPSFQPSPHLVYIEQGSGFLGINLPGCAETFQSQPQSTREQRGQEEEQGQQGQGQGQQQEKEQEQQGQGQQREKEQEQQGQGQQQQTQRSRRDQHQKIQPFRKGDIIAIPAGVSHWCYNNGNEDVVVLIVNDLNNQANQLDQRMREFYLAGSVPRQGQQGERTQETFQNIFRAFDEELMAEAFNVPREIINKMQKEDERGLIVKARGESMKVIRPDQEEEEQQQQQQEQGGQGGQNGVEETWCTLKIRHNIDKRRDAEIYSRQAGRINVVNRHKLPILTQMDMSAEKGNLYPNAIYSPHWSMNGHSVIYVTRGEAQVQVVEQNGETIFDDKVKQGDMFVIPQFFTSMARAGQNGFEWISIKTTGEPMKYPLVGYTSVIRAMPIDVITNSYQIRPSEARKLKENRGRESFLLSPSRTSS